MSDTFVMSVRQAAELDHAFARNLWTPEEVKKLSQGDFLTQVRRLMKGHAYLAEYPHEIDCDTEPKFNPEYWHASFDSIEHTKMGIWRWDVAQVGLWPNTIYGAEGEAADQEGLTIREVREKFASHTLLGANVLEYLIKHRHLLPKEWEQGTLLFLGTVYVSGGERFVPNLQVHPVHGWTFGFSNLNLKWKKYNYRAALRICE